MAGFFGSSGNRNDMAIVAAGDRTQPAQEADVTGAGLSVQPYAGSNPLPSSKRPVSVIEMLEFVKSLEIDPVKESEMLWMAEEAFHAQLPPGWDEHTDEHGRVYFHNIATGESCWQHPMDELFKEIVDYWRRVQTVGGFWEIEDELRDLEDQIRQDLNDWMELFDEHGEKFFYNRRTEESRFDDPRNWVYHDLYQRIKMVAKMKERLPLLARAPRPEDPTEAELELQKQLEEEQERYLACVIKIQSAARALFVKRKVRAMRAKRVFDRGHQPLRGRLELRLERGVAGKREAVLAETGPHRRQKAAAKIQARVRGVQARMAFRPIVAHRQYMASKALIIQKVARPFAQKRLKKRKAEERLHKAAIVIQRHVRGRQARKYVKTIAAEHKRFHHMLAMTIKCQSVFRVGLAKAKVKRRREEIRQANVAIIKKFSKAWLAKLLVAKRYKEANPITCYFVPTEDPRCRGMIPWTWRLWMNPVNKRGQVQDLPYLPTDLFESQGRSSLVRQAATKLQARVRGKRSRVVMATKYTISRFVGGLMVDEAYKELVARQKAALKIQTRWRGYSTRKKDIIKQKYRMWLQKVTPKMQSVQAAIRRFFTMDAMMEADQLTETSRAVIIIQSYWRGYLARKATKLLKEQAMWPLKLWFEYTPQGPESVKVQVQCLTNPRFDAFRYFCVHGTFDELNERLEDMVTETQKLKNKPGQKKKKKGKGRSGSRPQSGGPSSGRRSSKASSYQSEESEGKDKRKRRNRTDSKADTEGGSSNSSKVTGSKTAGSTVEETGSGSGSKRSKARTPGSGAGRRPESRDGDGSRRPGSRGEGTWSPRRGHLLSPESSPRARAESPKLGRKRREGGGESKSMTEALDSRLVEEEAAGPEADPLLDPADSEAGSETDKPAEKPPEPEPPKPPPPSALQVLQASHAGLPGEAPNSVSMPGKPGQLSEAELAGLTEEQRIEYERQMKVAELVRRQEKHAARRHKEKLREVERLQQDGTPQDKIAEEHRRRKAKELKRLLKRLEEENLGDKAQRPGMKDVMGKLQHIEDLEKIEQQHQEMRERRLQIAEQRRRKVAEHVSPSPTMTTMSTMGMTKSSDRVLHRHVHHHVHYHDGIDDPSATMSPGRFGTGQSASAIDLRASGGLGSRAPTEGMPWRPLVHSSSAGAIGMGQTRAGLPGAYADSMDMDRTAETLKMPGLSQRGRKGSATFSSGRSKSGYQYQSSADMGAGSYAGGSGRQRAF
mmetsp:Transcript_124768/g.216353  ORF Transcript_124768/g.216353 Transcript_124768/m.216353 type:complete len:1232 (-) Transcript_124768:44-3739(-)